MGLDTAEFLAIENELDLEAARDFPFPAILKTATLGYDGKGQVVCETFDALADAWQQVEDRVRGGSLGQVQVKGKGAMELFEVSGIRRSHLRFPFARKRNGLE